MPSNHDMKAYPQYEAVSAAQSYAVHYDEKLRDIVSFKQIPSNLEATDEEYFSKLVDLVAQTGAREPINKSLGFTAEELRRRSCLQTRLSISSGLAFVAELPGRLLLGFCLLMDEAMYNVYSSKLQELLQQLDEEQQFGLTGKLRADAALLEEANKTVKENASAKSHEASTEARKRREVHLMLLGTAHGFVRQATYLPHFTAFFLRVVEKRGYTGCVCECTHPKSLQLCEQHGFQVMGVLENISDLGRYAESRGHAWTAFANFKEASYGRDSISIMKKCFGSEKGWDCIQSRM